ncbi:hypothetical protein RO3G_05540 [Rhizopus delemar RA 99-880]|uniref:Uncharacterized protein n=1 Tax=Rhizopus delemar (strain RA 99-880 / ATCC MYA-4621 / FGSC 9543 / NRRL 43880) TaxID=246409 RepID=I1BXA5_RHIO9|nr:hypothetical protein RO3G_05540 [Rhizopus delemar RA 99-880]|eukprot:EIE80835.1 hypothetical protein RO3G_05540 [Rhizopus delemar RA 99-880]
MSRKTERAAKKASKKAEKVIIEEKEEEIPEAVPLEDNFENEVSEEEEIEEVSGEDAEEDAEEEEEEEEEETQKQRAIRPKINDEAAMIRITEEFKLKNLPWIETMTVTSSKPVVVEDATDDMARELAFYEQALEAAKMGRELVKKAGVEFSRPDDYFAEMVKSDEHMAKIRQKLLDQEASIKASEDAKRQRQLKKFGKKVQVEKQLERQKQKSETLEKIKLLKKSKFEHMALERI